MLRQAPHVLAGQHKILCSTAARLLVMMLRTNTCTIEGPNIVKQSAKRLHSNGANNSKMALPMLASVSTKHLQYTTTNTRGRFPQVCVKRLFLPLGY